MSRMGFAGGGERRRALFVAALTATTALGTELPSFPASAQSTATSAAQSAVRDFDIPAQPVADALIQFGRQSGLQATSDVGVVQGLRSSPVQGSMTWQQALNALLAGTGLTYRLNGTMVSVQKPPEGTSADGTMTLPPVQVEGRDGPPSQALIGNTPPAYAGGQVATGTQVGFLGNREITDTPFNVTSYTQQLIQDQQAHSISDVLANNPSVRMFYPDNDGSTDFFIRGNKVSQLDIAYDGLYGIGTPGIESIDRVDVLVGANALLNGLGPIGGVGGMINQVPKRPVDTPLTELSTGYIGGQYGGSADVSRRFGPGDQFGIRLNGAYRDGGTGADHQSRTVGTATAALDWYSLDNRARLSVNLGYRDNENQSPTRTTYMLTNNFPIPAAPNASSNWQNAWSYDNTYTKFGTMRGEFDITHDITAYAAVGASRFTEEEFFSNSFLMNSQGEVGQKQTYWPLFRNTITGEAGVRGSLPTGPVMNRWSLAVSGLRETNGITETSLETTYSNIYDPIFVPEPSIAGLADSNHIPKTGGTDLSGIALADTLSVLDDRVQLTLGVRRQGVSATNYDATSGAITSTYDKSALTPAYGLVVKPWRGLSLYANYIEGLQEGVEVPAGYANAGQTFPPFVSKQYEVGARYDFGKFLVTLGAYQITTPNAEADGLVYDVDGEQRTNGLELNTYGEVLPGVRLLGGLALIDARQTHTANGTDDGKRVAGASNVQVNLASEWSPAFLPGWTLSGRGIYTGPAYIDAGNEQSIPGWTQFDTGIRYTTAIADRETTFRFNVDNVTNNSYWGGGNDFVMISRPRTFLFSISASL